MATLRQMQANRRNAQASTGPRTAEGRAASAGNARTHGLSSTASLGEEENALVAERVAEYERELKPEGFLQRLQVHEIAAASVRVERCRADEDARRSECAQRAETRWEVDREVETAELGQKIHLRPELTALRLQQTLQGCVWMRTEWTLLGALQQKAAGTGPPGPLDETARNRACDLLGLSAEQRTVQTPLDLPAGANANGAGEEASGDADAQAAALGAHQAAFIAAQVAKYDELVADDGDLAALNESLKAEAALCNGLGSDRLIRLYRRYETEAVRRKERAEAELKRLQAESARTQAEEILAMKRRRSGRPEYQPAAAQAPPVPPANQAATPDAVAPAPASAQQSQPQAQAQPQRQEPAPSAAAGPESEAAARGATERTAGQPRPAGGTVAHDREFLARLRERRDRRASAAKAAHRGFR